VWSPSSRFSHQNSPVAIADTSAIITRDRVISDRSCQRPRLLFDWNGCWTIYVNRIGSAGANPRPLNVLFAVLGTGLGTELRDTVANRCHAAKHVRRPNRPDL
jgi:hypothetical protein